MCCSLFTFCISDIQLSQQHVAWCYKLFNVFLKVNAAMSRPNKTSVLMRTRALVWAFRFTLLLTHVCAGAQPRSRCSLEAKTNILSGVAVWGVGGAQLVRELQDSARAEIRLEGPVDSGRRAQSARRHWLINKLQRQVRCNVSLPCVATLIRIPARFLIPNCGGTSCNLCRITLPMSIATEYDLKSPMFGMSCW